MPYGAKVRKVIYQSEQYYEAEFIYIRSKLSIFVQIHPFEIHVGASNKNSGNQIF